MATGAFTKRVELLQFPGMTKSQAQELSDDMQGLKRLASGGGSIALEESRSQEIMREARSEMKKAAELTALPSGVGLAQAAQTGAELREATSSLPDNLSPGDVKTDKTDAIKAEAITSLARHSGPIVVHHVVPKDQSKKSPVASVSTQKVASVPEVAAAHKVAHTAAPQPKATPEIHAKKKSAPFSEDKKWSVAAEKQDMDSYFDNLDDHAAVAETAAREKRSLGLHETTVSAAHIRGAAKDLKVIPPLTAKAARKDEESYFDDEVKEAAAERRATLAGDAEKAKLNGKDSIAVKAGAKTAVKKPMGYSDAAAKAHFDDYFQRQVESAQKEAEKQHHEQAEERRVEAQRAAMRKAEELKEEGRRREHNRAVRVEEEEKQMELKMQDEREHARQERIMREEERHSKIKKMSAAEARIDFESYFDHQLKAASAKPDAQAHEPAAKAPAAPQAKRAAAERLKAKQTAAKKAAAPELQQWPGLGGTL